MTIHEFGQNHDEVVVLVHPSATMWDYFEYVIPLMQDRYHLIVPALPGYDTETGSDFTSVPEIAEKLANWLIAHGHREITNLIYRSVIVCSQQNTMKGMR